MPICRNLFLKFPFGFFLFTVSIKSRVGVLKAITSSYYARFLSFYFLFHWFHHSFFQFSRHFFHWSYLKHWLKIDSNLQSLNGINFLPFLAIFYALHPILPASWCFCFVFLFLFFLIFTWFVAEFGCFECLHLFFYFRFPVSVFFIYLPNFHYFSKKHSFSIAVYLFFPNF